ncbi:MAG: sirohydrochlorin chelatase [Bacillota bacterium]
MKTAVVLLSHGSRLARAQEELRSLVEMVAARGDWDAVEGASFQFHQPDLPAVLAKLAARGMERVIIVPLFLFHGIHLQEDIPPVLEAEREKYPQMQILVSRHLGADAGLAEIVCQRVREVQAGR